MPGMTRSPEAVEYDRQAREAIAPVKAVYDVHRRDLGSVPGSSIEDFGVGYLLVVQSRYSDDEHDPVYVYACPPNVSEGLTGKSEWAVGIDDYNRVGGQPFSLTFPAGTAADVVARAFRGAVLVLQSLDDTREG